MTGAAKWREEYPELWDEEWVRKRYIDLDMSDGQIAEELGFDCPRSAVISAVQRFGLRKGPQHARRQRAS